MASLETALRRAGRVQLVDQFVIPLQRLISLLTSLPEPEEARAVALIKRALTEIKACVADARRAPDDALLREVEAMTAPATARSMLDSLSEAEDDELRSMIASIDSTDHASPCSRPTRALTDELGTLREPVSSGAPGSGRVLMKGEIAPGLLADLIQLFAQNQETGCLAVDGDGTSGQLFFKVGQVYDADCAGATGERGFFHLMKVRTGRFSYQRGVESPAVRIHRSAQQLIMDTLRLIDEGS